MSNIKYIQCDNCRKASPDFTIEEQPDDWITIQQGDKNNNRYITLKMYNKSYIAEHKSDKRVKFDFCSIRCLVEYVSGKILVVDPFMDEEF